MAEKPLASGATSSDPGPEPRQTLSVGGTDATTPQDTVVPTNERAFADGERIAGRYLVVRLVGQGGMGEVYEVEDLELHSRVALKTIRAQAANSDLALERFKREILLARKVTHPSVGRIFDLGQHTRPGRFAPVNFFTMELLSGESLAERLQRGPLSVDEARPLLTQMAAALDAAHAAGVVHRDFKSGNVMLADGSSRAVVTDFGMARSVESDVRITGGGGLLGTPAYMAPEQIEDGNVTPAADVYALGVVAFEMVTGRLPFVGKSALETAAKRLSQPAPAPRTILPSLDARWDAAILRALAREPGERFASAGEFARALAATAPPPRARRWPWFAAALTLAVAVAAPLVWRWAHKRAATPPQELARPVDEPAAPKARRAVALLGFKNLSGAPQTQWLSTALAEMLGVELAASDGLRTIPGEEVEHTKQALKIGDGQVLDGEQLQKVARALGADELVSGSYLDLGDGASAGLRVDVRIVDAKTGAVTVVTEEGTQEGLLALVSRAGSRLRDQLGDGRPQAVDDQALRAALPSTAEAARLYAEGLDKLHRFDVRDAQKLLRQAVQRDPDNALIRSDLAKADKDLGLDAEARAESERAVAHAHTLPREKRLIVEAKDDELHFQWDRALAVYQALRVFYPDNLEYGARLAEAQVLGGQSKEALVTDAALRALPHSADIGVRLDLIDAQAQEKLSDWSAELAAADRAALGANAIGASVELARARRRQAWAYLRQGKTDEAFKAAEDCRRLFEDAGNPWGAAQAYNMIANVERTRNHNEAAERAWQKSLSLAESAGDQDGQATALSNLASLMMDEGQLERAEPLFLQVLAISRRTGDNIGLAYTLGDLGTLYARRDRYADSIKALEESRQLLIKTGNQLEAAISTSDLGALRRTMGDGDLARGLHRDALAAFEAVHDEAQAGLQRLWLATLDVDDGELAHSEVEVKNLIPLFARKKTPEYEAGAHVLLARIALQQGKLDAAAREAQQALTVAAPLCSDDARQCIDAHVMLARTALAKHDLAQANHELSLAEKDATQRHDRVRLLEIAIVRGQTESGDARRRHLVAVAQEARRYSFLQLARRADDVLAGKKVP